MLFRSIGATAGAASLEEQAIAKRDAEIARAWTLNSEDRSDLTTIAAGYDKVTGKVRFAAKSSLRFRNKEVCVEDLVVAQLGGIENIDNIMLTPAIRPRTMQVIPVCNNCQAKYPRSSFIPGTPFL